MAEGGIRDLLVKLGLDISDFTSKNKLLKGELNALKTEFKAVESDETIANRSDQLKQNLESQIRAVKDQIANYKTEIDSLYAAMQGAAGDGKKESYLVQQMNLAQTALNNSQSALNDLEKIYKKTPFDSIIIAYSNPQEDKVQLLRDFCEKHNVELEIQICRTEKF